MFDIPAYLYSQVYYWTAFALCAFIYFRYSASNNNSLLLQQNSFAYAFILCVIAILFIGLRPVSWLFGDMWTYAKGYNYYASVGHVTDAKGEWAFAALQMICIKLGLPAKMFFLVCAIGYIGFQYWACRKLLWENSHVAMLFILSAFEFFVFAVNGVRNGLACGMVMFAMAVAITSNRQFWRLLLAAGIAYLAFGIHRSTAISSACAVAAFYYVKNPKYALYIWLASIPVSLVMGNFFINMFTGMVEDNRASAYAAGASFDESHFSRTGFRWDFLLYSTVPVILTWYVTQKKKIQDETFNFLANTYLLANAFWILVIQANFSNRFAYLSWFLYPLVLAYGLIRLHIWENQDRKIGLYLLLHAGFTLVMFLLGKI